MKGKIVLALSVIFVFVSCADNHVEIRIPMEKADVVNFDHYKTILVSDFHITASPETVAPSIGVTDFFIKDFAKFIDKKIEYLEPGEGENGRAGSLSEKLGQFADALLITGKLEAEMKEHNKIKEVKNKFGDKIRSFVKVQNWTMKMEIDLIESASGKSAGKFTFEDRIKESENLETEFNVQALFNRITDKFIGKITRKKTYQRRYLLLR